MSKSAETISAYFRRLGKKARGASKTRSPEHYAAMVAIRAAKRQARVVLAGNPTVTTEV